MAGARPPPRGSIVLSGRLRRFYYTVLEGMIYGNVHRIRGDVPDLIRFEEYYRFRDEGG